MELRLKISADMNELRSTFEYDEVILIKYYERIRPNVYDVIARLPECSLKPPVNVIPLKKFREKVIKACPDVFRITAEVTFENGVSRKIYAVNEYWIREDAIQYGKRDNTIPVDYHIVQIDGNNVCLEEKERCLFAKRDMK